MDSKSKSKSKSKNSKTSDSKKKKNRISKPTDIIFFKKNRKNIPATEDDQASNRAMLYSRFSSSGTIYGFPSEDGESRGAALPPLVMKTHTKTAAKVASEPWKKAVKKVRTKKKVDKGATL